jgi:hypothetical protein
MSPIIRSGGFLSPLLNWADAPWKGSIGPCRPGGECVVRRSPRSGLQQITNARPMDVRMTHHDPHRSLGNLLSADIDFLLAAEEICDLCLSLWSFRLLGNPTLNPWSFRTHNTP